MALKYNLNYILPPFYEFVQYRKKKDNIPYPFNNYFSVSNNKNIEFINFNKILDKKIIYIVNNNYNELNHKISKYYKLKNKIKRVIKTNKDNLKDVLKLLSNETILISNNLLNHKEFGVYSDYLYGQGWNVNKSENFKEVFKLFIPNINNQNIINIFLNKYSIFNNIHIRRGDYNSKLSEMSNIKYKNTTLKDKFGINSFYQNNNYIIKYLEKNNIDNSIPIFVCSENSLKLINELNNLQNKYKFICIYNINININKQDIIGLIERYICSYGNIFIGNRYSSFSSDIKNIRQLTNKNTLYW